MHFDFVLADRMAVGGGIWCAQAMAELAQRGFTHILSLQADFDDRELAAEHGIEVLWNPVEDDLEPKPPLFFERSVAFAVAALQTPGTRLYVHCSAGVHRAPITAAAILCGLGCTPAEAVGLVGARRAWAKFPPTYLESLERWHRERNAAA